MASSAGFKQQCPSCEAMVPIRDPNLIGRKIDCPKCKYRFVVEDPGSDEDEEAPARGKKGKAAKAGAAARNGANGKSTAVQKKPGLRARRGEDDDDDDDAPPKKKSGGSATLFIGIGLAAVGALIVVGGVVWIVMNNSGSDNGPKSRSVAVTPSADDDATKPEADKPPAPALADITNMLPNEAENVISVNVERVLNSGANRALFQSAGGFNLDAFQKRMGFPFADVQRVVTTDKHPGKKDGWVFTVVRTAKPKKLEELTRTIGLTKAEKSPVEGQEFYEVNGELDTLSRFLLIDGRSSETIYFHYYDEQTLIFATEAPMLEFLKAKRQPKFLTQAAAADGDKKDEAGGAAPGGAPGGMPGMGGAGGAPGTSMPGGGPGMTSGPGRPPGMGGGPSTSMPGGGGGMPGMMRGGPGAGMPGMPGFAGGEGASETSSKTSTSWMTIKPSMKVVLDELDDPKEPPILLVASDPSANPDLFRAPGATGEISALEKIQQQASEIDAGGASLQQLANSRVAGQVALVCKKEEFAKQFENLARLVAPAAAQALGKALDLKVAVKDEGGGGPGMPGGFGMPGSNPMMPGGPGMMPGGPGMMPGGPGMMGGRPSTNGPGGAGMPGGPGMMPGGPGMMPGGPGMMPGGPGMMGGRPSTNGPGGAGMPGGPGMMPGMPGANGPGAGEQPGENEPEKPTSAISFRRVGKTVVAGADLALSLPAYEKLMQESEHGVVMLKGHADMDGRPHIHQLAKGLKAYADKNGQFPRGTVERPPSAEHAFLPWRPDQRVSWMPDLLPFLGDGEFANLARQVKPDKSWDDEDNLVTAQTLIPYYLVGDAPASWWVSYPGVSMPVAATDFVGVAGVGLDAATYPASDKRAGVFGYDRATRVADVKDGLDKTIALLQVPLDYKTCWLAGGGSTVRGVPDSDSIRPFVCTKYQGKRGTFAVMCDGRVRFIPETIADKDFQALCTINGGEKVDVNKVAPEVAGGKVELKTLPAAVPTPTNPPPRPTLVVPPAPPRSGTNGPPAATPPGATPPTNPPAATPPRPPAGNANNQAANNQAANNQAANNQAAKEARREQQTAEEAQRHAQEEARRQEAGRRRR